MKVPTVLQQIIIKSLFTKTDNLYY